MDTLRRTPMILAKNYSPVLIKVYTISRQAISNTQIVDNFHVVHCKDPKDVVGYLALMTQYLRSLYTSKTLCAVRHEAFKDVHMNMEDQIQHLVTFGEFSKVAEKNKDLRVRELFAKQLMVLAGISPDRAFSIVSQYPTPEALMQKYDSVQTAKEREDLLKDLKCGLTQRKLGPAISKMLAQMYGVTGALK
jgi:hypothetical protein